MATKASEMRRADLLLRCTDGGHRDCNSLRDALIRGFPNVMTAFPTRVTLDAEYCVAASALVSRRDAGAFRRRLEAFSGPPGGPGVSRVHMLVSGSLGRLAAPAGRGRQAGRRAGGAAGRESGRAP